jgi:hypothetical protein
MTKTASATSSQSPSPTQQKQGEVIISTIIRKPSPQQKIRDEQIEHYLQVAQGYMPYVKLRIKRWKPDYRILWRLMDEDAETGGSTELSRPMKKREIYENLYCLAQLLARAEKIKRDQFQKSLRLDQELEARNWEKAKEETTTE